MGKAPKPALPASGGEGHCARQEQTSLPPLAGDTALHAEPKNTSEGLLCQQPLPCRARRSQSHWGGGWLWDPLLSTCMRSRGVHRAPCATHRTKPIAGLAGAQAPLAARRKERPVTANSCASWKPRRQKVRRVEGWWRGNWGDAAGRIEVLQVARRATHSSACAAAPLRENKLFGFAQQCPVLC